MSRAELVITTVLSGSQSALETARQMPHALPSPVTSLDTSSPPAHMDGVKSGNEASVSSHTVLTHHIPH